MCLRRFLEQSPRRDVAIVAGQTADDGQLAFIREALGRFFQRALTADIDDEIGAMSVRELCDSLRPRGLALVVDARLRPESLRTLKFLVRAARDDHTSSGSGGELQSESRN